MDKAKKIGLALAPLALLAGNCFAAVDNDVQNAATSTAGTIKDNIMGALSTNIPTVILAGVFILAVTVIWRMGKRFVR